MITGKILPESWEKAKHFKLSNGWIAIINYNSFHGEYITQLSKNGKVWLASNGSIENGLGAEHYNKVFKTDKYIDLPDFAKEWRDNNQYKLVRPNFEKIYN
jgi:hypothetical protein